MSEQGVYQAFVAAMQDIKAVAKDGKNTQQGYSFRGIDGVLNTVGPVFRDNDLFLLPEVIDHTVQLTERSNKSPIVSVYVKVKYTVVHLDGSSFSGISVGEGIDYSDKATSKAMSVALRTFLLQSLVLPTHDKSPEDDDIQRPPQSSIVLPTQAQVDEAEQALNVEALASMETAAGQAGDAQARAYIGAARLRAKRQRDQMQSPQQVANVQHPDAPPYNN